MTIWNPWHGCKKVSPGCLNCYVYRRDSSFGKDSSQVTKTKKFFLPLSKTRKGEYKIKNNDGKVYTCMTSDFFLPEADVWRREAWNIIRSRQDLEFVIITKRIERFYEELPLDWGEGYKNVTIVCTCENQEMADRRLEIFLELPILNREIISEPMLEKIDIEKYLAAGKISGVTCGGESGENARPCNYEWILDMREQCIRQNVSFHFKQTGQNFIKDGKRYSIDRKYQMVQADRAGIDFTAEKPGKGEFDNLFARLKQSAFRDSFKLGQRDLEYIDLKGMEKIESHCRDFVRERLAPDNIPNDGKQTPMRGHPVFIAQHATATCCRGCLYKWHKIPPDRNLSQKEQDYVVSVIMEWIRRQSADK